MLAQPCLACLLPLIKYAHMRIATKLSYGAAGGKHFPARVVSVCIVGIAHQLFILIFVGFRATAASAYLIVGFDCIPNVCSCISLLRGYSQIRDAAEVDQNQNQTESLQCLILKEIVEILVPAAYCLTLPMAYYGPNTGILGSIGSDYWCYIKIADFGKTFSRLGTVIVVITLSLGATLTYIIANYFFKDLIKEKFTNKFKFLEEKIKSNEFFVIFLLRIIGGTPLQIQNLLPVLFNVKLKNYFLASIGFLPQAFVFSSLGAGLENQIKKNEEPPSFLELITSFEIYGPILAFFVLLVFVFLLQKIFYKN